MKSPAKTVPFHTLENPVAKTTSESRNTKVTSSKTELVGHVRATGHNFDFAAATTLAKEGRWGPHKLLES